MSGPALRRIDPNSAREAVRKYHFDLNANPMIREQNGVSWHRLLGQSPNNALQSAAASVPLRSWYHLPPLHGAPAHGLRQAAQLSASSVARYEPR